MSKLIIKDSFGVTPNHLLNNPDISLQAKGLFAYCQSKPNNWEFSAEKMTYQNKNGLTSVTSALHELEGFGYLKRKRYQDENGFWKVDYELSAFPTSENPTSENPRQENPNSDYPTSENLPNISKKEVSKKEVVRKSIEPEELKTKFLNNPLYAEICKQYPHRNYDLQFQLMCDWWRSNRNKLPVAISAFSKWLSNTQIDERIKTENIRKMQKEESDRNFNTTEKKATPESIRKLQEIKNQLIKNKSI